MQSCLVLFTCARLKLQNFKQKAQTLALLMMQLSVLYLALTMPQILEKINCRDKCLMQRRLNYLSFLNL